LIIPFYYTQEELKDILIINNIDLDTGIKECKQYMALNGWCISKKIIVDKKTFLIKNNGVFKNIVDFKGWEIYINKRNNIVASIMENEKDAMIVCIIEAIKTGI
jgi:hypothetical protein